MDAIMWHTFTKGGMVNPLYRNLMHKTKITFNFKKRESIIFFRAQRGVVLVQV